MSIYLALSLLLYCLTLMKRLRKRVDGDYTRMQRAVLNKFWKHHPTKHHLKNHPRRKWQSEHCWRSRDEFKSDFFVCTPTQRHTSVDRLAKSYMHHLCVDTGCNDEDHKKARRVGTNGGSGKGIRITLLLTLFLFYSFEFFTLGLADDFSLEVEWEQVPSNLQDTSKYSG